MTFLMIVAALAVAGSLGIVVRLALRNSQPTQSVANLLYDTEHPVGATAPTGRPADRTR
ncbi:MAG: hypothetical protein OEW19_06500 [Acidobacteriota bacterium]|nr:hypothetical protein [Acidobacteriota bacterium]